LAAANEFQKFGGDYCIFSGFSAAAKKSAYSECYNVTRYISDFYVTNKRSTVGAYN